MPRKISTASDIEGLFIYHDKRNRTVYCDPFVKCGYVITNSLVGKYIFYSSKFIVALSVGLIGLYIIDWNPMVGLIAGIITYIAITILFYVRFLPLCTKIENFVKPPKENYIERNSKADRLTSNASTAALATALPIVLLINMYQEGYTGLVKAANVGLAVAAAVFACLSIYLTVVSAKKARELKKANR